MKKVIRRNLKSIFALAIGKKQKHVIEIPAQLRFGNLLYFYLHCYIMRRQNKLVYILHTKTMDYWLEYFPRLQEFILYANDFKFYDNLDYFSSYYQNFGVDFKTQELNDFIHNYILPDLFFKYANYEERTVINIRRGDFYSSKQKSPSEFNQVQFVKKVLINHSIIRDLPIYIISDDIAWCKKNLSFFGDLFHFISDNEPYQDFISICTAKNLVVTNSTFSYWGGYISKAINEKNVVIAPVRCYILCR